MTCICKFCFSGYRQTIKINIYTKTVSLTSALLDEIGYNDCKDDDSGGGDLISYLWYPLCQKMALQSWDGWCIRGIVICHSKACWPLTSQEPCDCRIPAKGGKGVWTTVPALDLQFIYDERSEPTVRKSRGWWLRGGGAREVGGRRGDWGGG